MITGEELKTQLSYDATTGLFTRLVSNNNYTKVGEVAGHLHRSGYVRIYCYGKQCQAHRLAWLYVYGELPNYPEFEIDHINKIKHDNRITNLRVVSHGNNIVNSKVRTDNSSGVIGVRRRQSGKWSAKLAGKWLGTFLTMDEAITARNGAELNNWSKS